MRWVYAVAVAGIAAVLAADIWADIDFERWANVALLAMATLVTCFAGLYAGRSAWWAHRIGRVFLIKLLVLSTVLLQVSLAVWWQLDYPGRQHIRFVIYTAGAAVYLPMLITLWREQQRDRRR